MEIFRKTFLKTLLGFVCILCITTTAHAITPPSSDIQYEGMDVSIFQGEIDYEQVKQARYPSGIYSL